MKFLIGASLFPHLIHIPNLFFYFLGCFASSNQICMFHLRASNLNHLLTLHLCAYDSNFFNTFKIILLRQNQFSMKSLQKLCSLHLTRDFNASLNIDMQRL